jgi:hypothetical protein
MSNYDFRQLSPHDFEQLARDLIQARDGIFLESFKNGRDVGIDFRPPVPTATLWSSASTMSALAFPD